MSDENNYRVRNDGVFISGSGTTNIVGNAFGPRAKVINIGSEAAPASPRKPYWHVGVITVLSEETRAIKDRFKRMAAYREHLDEGGACYIEAMFESDGGTCRLVLVQALDRGTRSAVQTFSNLVHRYEPGVIALVGIAGGIHADVALGDVVVGQEVIYYDRRKETPAGVQRRASSQAISGPIRGALNRFFTDRGEPVHVNVSDPDGARRTFSLVRGPIGSGEAVVADENSDIAEYLRKVNYQTLAVETEGAGASWAFYEAGAKGIDYGRWVVVRGISDHANKRKDDSYHNIASWHAATVLEMLCPYLMQATLR